jgi:hypothetical protein
VLKRITLEQLEKLTTEDTTEGLHGEEEGILGMNPARIARIKTASGNDTVEMRMQSKVLSPGVQNANESDLGSKVLGVGRNFKHGLSAGTEEQIIEQPWVTLTERIQQVR